MAYYKVKVGDRVQYIDGFENEYDPPDLGTVTRIDSTSKVWVLYDDTNKEVHCIQDYLTLVTGVKDAIEPKHAPLRFPPHKYAAVITHWAHGGEIQVQSIDGVWHDYEDQQVPPSLIDIHDFEATKVFGWRIKPNTKIIRFRTAMTNDNTVKLFTEDPMLDDAYGPDGFKHWIDPEWKTVTVEE